MNTMEKPPEPTRSRTKVVPRIECFKESLIGPTLISLLWIFREVIDIIGSPRECPTVNDGEYENFHAGEQAQDPESEILFCNVFCGRKHSEPDQERD